MEELLEMLEKTANLLRGMAMDPDIPAHAKTAANKRASEIDLIVEKYTED
jgi:hypothetical protein